MTPLEEPETTAPLVLGNTPGCATQARPLHVVFLTSWMRFPRGMAATNRALLLARALVGAGAEVRFLIMQASERPPVVENRDVEGVHQGVRFEYTAGTTIRHASFVMRRLIELNGWAGGIRRLGALRAARELDVVYLWLTSQRLQPSRVVFLAILRLLRVPVVIELNERPWSTRTDIRADEKRLSPLRGTAGAVSISAFLFEWARQEAARLTLPFEVLDVPIVVDMLEARPDPHPDDQPIVVFAGAPQYDETLRFVFDAMGEVWRRFPECRLVVTGSNPADPAARWLMRAAAEGTLDERVVIAGYLSRDALLAQYSRAHALLIPLFDDVRSRARFPTKIGEYLASGRPIVTTSVGEMPRFFEDHVSAFMCGPGDVGAYGSKVCEALADAGRAARVGAAGREVARRSFHYALYGPALRDGFAKAATRRRTR